MERVKTNELSTSSKSTRNFMEKSAIMKALLKIVGVLGVSLVMSGKSNRIFDSRMGLMLLSQMVSSHQLSLSWVPSRGM